jgi:thiol-disulfide isomerase/thioredoxin
MASFKGKPLLLNFWATWCPPCVEEMPLLDRFFTENSANGWQVLGLAVDQAAPVKRFLEARPVGFAIALAGLAGTDLSRTLGNSAGGLPFSVAFDRSGRIVQRKMGQLGAQDLQQWRSAT